MLMLTQAIPSLDSDSAPLLLRKHNLLCSDARAHQESRWPERLLALRVHADGRMPCHPEDGQRLNCHRKFDNM